MLGFTDAISYFLFSRHKYGYGIHSPFAYAMITKVFRDKNKYAELKEIEEIRHLLRRDKRKIKRVDYGAGKQNGKEVKVATEVRKSAVRRKYGELLFRLSAYLKPNVVLELGTSLGISTMYIAAGYRETRVVTLEGDPHLARLAQENFTSLNIKNIEQVVGPFAETLPGVLENYGPFDMVFLDGDHRGDRVLDNLRKIRDYLSPEACILLDDIHWSTDMVSGWKAAVNLPEVTLSMDLLQFGILFFNPSLTKEHLVIRY